MHGEDEYCHEAGGTATRRWRQGGVVTLQRADSCRRGLIGQCVSLERDITKAACLDHAWLMRPSLWIPAIYLAGCT
jgi:hypothetical protein